MSVGFSGSNSGAIGDLSKIGNDFHKNLDLTLIDIFVNQRCNLNCKGCYVNESLPKGEYALEDLFAFLKKAIEKETKIIAITGKEPLLDLDKTLKILKFIFENKKGEFPKTGLVTNGTLLKDIDLRFMGYLDFLDISIDGTKEIHDFLRGKGNFDRTMQGIEKVKKKYPFQKVFIDFTLNKRNKNCLGDFILFLNSNGLKNLVISPHYRTSKADSLVLLEKDFLDVLIEVRKILQENLLSDFNVFIKQDYLHYNFRENVFKVNFYDPIKKIDKDYSKKIFIDAVGSLFYVDNIKSSKIYCNLFNPKDLRTGFRINSNGDVTNCLHMFKGEEYCSLGNIKNHSVQDILFKIKENLN